MSNMYPLVYFLSFFVLCHLANKHSGAAGLVGVVIAWIIFGFFL